MLETFGNQMRNHGTRRSTFYGIRKPNRFHHKRRECTEMSEHLRIPFAQSLREAIDRRIAEAIQRIGGPLPCTIKSVSGAIVTVTVNVQGPVWPDVICTSQQSPYVREPLQVGDTGVIFPCAVDIGNVTGLSPSGNSSSDEPTNLSAMVFLPTGSKNYPSVDANRLVLRGPPGALIAHTN